MAEGPRGEKRPADAIGCAVHVARIATAEIIKETRLPSGRVRSGHAGARARKNALTSDERWNVAAAEARRHRGS